MRLRLLWVGKTKEPWAREAVEKYSKLIRPFAELEIVEIKEERGRGPKEPKARAVEAEGGRILDKTASYVLLDERGSSQGSREFSELLKDRVRLDFVVGGPWGVSDEVRAGAERTVSLSKMTLTHDMARIVLMEQIYRGFTIITGRGYHH